MANSRDDDALARARARRTGETLARARAALRWAPRAAPAAPPPDPALDAFAASMGAAAAALRATMRTPEEVEARRRAIVPTDLPPGLAPLARTSAAAWRERADALTDLAETLGGAAGEILASVRGGLDAILEDVVRERGDDDDEA